MKTIFMMLFLVATAGTTFGQTSKEKELDKAMNALEQSLKKQDFSLLVGSLDETSFLIDG